MNLIGAEGDDWKRHRRICSPAFKKNTYRSVFEATAKVYEEMIFKEGWDSVQRTGVVKANLITHKVSYISNTFVCGTHQHESQLALFIIAIIGFGMPMDWEEQKRGDRDRMPLQEVIYEVSTHVFERSRIPKILYATGLPFLKKLDEAYSTFDSFMREKIKQREKELDKLRSTPGATDDEIAESAGDVFGRLVNARMSEGSLSMSDEEIISNCFAFVSDFFSRM